MKINIYSSFNGVGLEKDYNILKGIFEAAGHQVDYADWKQRNGHRPEKADLAIHLEIARADLMGLATKNVLMPNPEWFDTRWISSIKRFQEVWCKTKDCLKVFSKYHTNCVFSGFTSLDFHTPSKKIMQFLHVQGASEFKGTHEILNCYATNDLPRLFLLSKKLTAASGNVCCGGFLSDEDFRKLMNACLIHLCPSYYEGFGHYLWEAMSCGAVVLTTNCPPMNEFISDKRFLVRCTQGWMHHLGELHRPAMDDLLLKIQAVAKMSEKELISEGEKNRQKFLKNDKEFKDRIISML